MGYPRNSFPLAKGRLDGDTLICGYHCMQFDPTGRCMRQEGEVVVIDRAAAAAEADMSPAPMMAAGHPYNAQRESNTLS